MARKKIDFTERSAFDQDSLLLYKETVSKYPYCACARLSFLLNLKALGDPAYETELPYTAIAVPDRQLLKAEVEAIEGLTNKGRRMIGVIENTLGVAKQLGQSSIVSTKERNEAELRGKSADDSNVEEIRERGFNPWEEVFSSTKTISALWSENENESEEEEQPRPLEQPKKQPNQSKPALKPKQAKTKLTSKQPTLTQQSQTVAYADPNELIERFIKQNSEHLLIKVDSNRNYDQYDPDRGSMKEDWSVGSETLAKIYIKQGSPEKAIVIYKNLSLKFPQKNRYFASLIKQAEKKL